MPNKLIMLFSFVLLACSPAIAATNDNLSSADSYALVPIAPAGRWVLQIEPRYNSYDHRYDQAGNRQPLGAPFDAIKLDANIFPPLALFGPGATLGTTSLQSSVTLQRIQITLGYGLNDNITIGGIANYGRIKVDANFAVANGNVGFNPLFNPAAPIGAGNFPFAPVGPGVPAMDASGINRILSDPLFGYGYEPIRTSSRNEFGDLLLGGLWRVYQGDHQAIVLGGGYRLDLSKANNPDNLFDLPLGDGSDDIVLELDYALDLYAGFDFRTQFKYTIQLPDHRTMRVPAASQILAPATTKESLGRNLGDYWESDLELGKSFGNWRVAATWHLWRKKQDHYYSQRGQNVATLVNGSNISADQWRASISWSGIHAWQQGVIPLPAIATITYQNTIRGTNMPDVRDLYLLLTALF